MLIRCFIPVLAGTTLLTACGGEGPVEPPADTTGPTVEVLVPTNLFAYDEDGDGLADFRIAYNDSTGLVDVAAITVRSLRPLDEPVSGDNLLEEWNVELQHDTMLVFHETLEHLLPSQKNLIVVSVPDRAGNVTEDTITIRLPFGELHTIVETGMQGPDQAGGLAYCADDHLLYVNAWHGELAIVDPDSLTVLAVTQPPSAISFGRMLCIPGDPALYITGSDVFRFDRVTRQWLPRVEGTSDPSSKLGLVQSRRDPNLLYVGYGLSRVVGIIDRARAERAGYLLTPEADKWVFALAVLPDDAALYATVWPDEGMLVIDPWTNEVRDTIDLSLSGPGLGGADNIALTSDARWLYAAVTDGPPAGVYVYDTQTNLYYTGVNLSDYRMINLALSPDEQRLFVTTQDRFPTMPSPNLLLELPTLTELGRFPRPRPAGETRWDQHVVFHPNGKLIFVAHNQNVDVYLNRR